MNDKVRTPPQPTTLSKNQIDAIKDCQYALSLSEIALVSHFNMWSNAFVKGINWTPDDVEYCLTLLEIQAKLHTNECLLKEGE